MPKKSLASSAAHRSVSPLKYNFVDVGDAQHLVLTLRLSEASVVLGSLKLLDLFLFWTRWLKMPFPLEPQLPDQMPLFHILLSPPE